MSQSDLSKWVNEFTSDLYNWALYKTSSKTIAEDLIQETFLAAAEKISTFRESSSPKTWLFSILNHKIIDHYRGRIHKPLVLESETVSAFFDDDGSWRKSSQPNHWADDDGHILDDDDFREILEKCMDALPEKWSHCVKLKYLSEKKREEICQELDLSPTNFWQIVHRAKLQLRDCIENNWFKN